MDQSSAVPAKWGERHMTGKLMYPINLDENGDVVTHDGEFIGTWETDEEDVMHHFTPKGASGPAVSSMWVGPFCKDIAAWYAATEGYRQERGDDEATA